MNLKPKTYNLKSNSGFTIVEFLIQTGLLAIFLVILTDLLVSIIEVKLNSETISSVEEDGRFIIARMNYDIHRASSVTAPATLGAASTSLVLVIGGSNYTYQLNGSNLELTDPLGTGRLNGSEAGVSGLSFQRLGNFGGKPTVKIQFSVNSVENSLRAARSKTFVSTGGLR